MPACGWSDFVIVCGVFFCSDVIVIPRGYRPAAAGGVGAPARADVPALPMC